MKKISTKIVYIIPVLILLMVYTVPAANLTVNAGDSITLSKDFYVNTNETVLIKSGGMLNTGNYKVYGPGTFRMESTAGLAISHAQGVNYTVQTTKKYWSIMGKYRFYGSNAQVTGTNLPDTVGILCIKKTYPYTGLNGLMLSKAVFVQTQLRLEGGIIKAKSGKYVHIAYMGTIYGGYTDNSYVFGAVRHTFASKNAITKLYPVGDSLKNYFVVTTRNHNNSNASVYEMEVQYPTHHANDIKSPVKQVAPCYWTQRKISGASQINTDFYWFSLNGMVIIPAMRGRYVIARYKINNTQPQWTAPQGSTKIDDALNAVSLSDNDQVNINDYVLATLEDVIADPLPVNFTYFKAFKNNDGTIALSWNTATETNNHYFVVEHAGENLEFRDLATVYGAGNSNKFVNYAYTDVLPLSGNNYYRLRQTDYDGQTTFSAVVVVKSLGSQNSISYQNGEIHFLLTNAYNDVLINLISADGKVVANQQLALGAGQHVYPLLLQNHQSGVYIARIKANNELGSFKIIYNK